VPGLDVWVRAKWATGAGYMMTVLTGVEAVLTGAEAHLPDYITFADIVLFAACCGIVCLLLIVAVWKLHCIAAHGSTWLPNQSQIRVQQLCHHVTFDISASRKIMWLNSSPF
jgi:hypothetical protein